MLAGLGGAAERGGALHHVGVADRPLVGLPRAHRPAGDKRQGLDSEVLGDQLVLSLDLVVERDLREVRLVVRGRRVARRARKPIAEHVRDDDEVLAGVEGHVLADEPFIVPVEARVPRRIDDRVALVGVQLAERLVRELRVLERVAVLKREISEIEGLVVLHELCGHLGPPRSKRKYCRTDRNEPRGPRPGQRSAADELGERVEQRAERRDRLTCTDGRRETAKVWPPWRASTAPAGSMRRRGSGAASRLSRRRSPSHYSRSHRVSIRRMSLAAGGAGKREWRAA